MSHVTRYDIAGASPDFMKERENGEFVKFEDYKKLETALCEAEQRTADLNMYIDRIEKFAETLPQVRSALDAINLALRDGE